MTVDPKYSDLPWIAHGQPDVFESEQKSLPEAEQSLSMHAGDRSELSSEALSHLSIADAAATRDKFLSKQLRPTGDRVDFSDRISASRRTGYIAFDAQEYAAGGPPVPGDPDAAKEMPMARFQRLQCEIAQLVAEVDAARTEVASAAAADQGAGLSSAARMSKTASGVCRRLTDAHLQRVVGDNVRSVETRTEAYAGGHGRMLKQIEAHRAKKLPALDASAEPRGSHIVCELYNSVDKVKNMENAKFAECEQRVQRLENLIGPSPPLPRFSLDSGPAGPRPLAEAASRLNSRVAALCEGSFLEQMESRLGAVHAKLGQVTQKKEAVTTADTENKVAELYEIVKKWECMAPVAPQLVDRLEVIKTLHEQAMQFNQSVTFIDTNQKEVAQLLKKHNEMLKKLEKSLSGNLGTVQASCDSLAARVKAVK